MTKRTDLFFVAHTRSSSFVYFTHDAWVRMGGDRLTVSVNEFGTITVAADPNGTMPLNQERLHPRLSIPRSQLPRDMRQCPKHEVRAAYSRTKAGGKYIIDEFHHTPNLPKLKAKTRTPNRAYHRKPTSKARIPDNIADLARSVTRSKS